MRFVRQVAPTIEDLTDRAKAIDAHTFEIPTGAWMTERREYHVSVDVPPGPLAPRCWAAESASWWATGSSQTPR